MVQSDLTQSHYVGEADAPLVWQNHLLRRHPERISSLLLTLFIGGTCVWLLFGRALPAIAAVAVLLGSAAEYLLPTTYHITTSGITARNLVSHSTLSWCDARRCLLDPSGLIITPLPVPSRLDRFRGVLLRFAPAGEPGDCASICAAIARYAPELSLPTGNLKTSQPVSTDDTPIETLAPGGCS